MLSVVLVGSVLIGVIIALLNAIYRDIGDVDSAMEPGEQQPKIAPPLPPISECLKLLA